MQCVVGVRTVYLRKVVVNVRSLRSFSRTATGHQRPSHGPPNSNSFFSNASNSSQSAQTEEKVDGSDPPSLRNLKVRTKVSDEEKFTERSLDGDPRSWRWLGKFAPGYATKGSNVKVFLTPNEYYQTLIQKTRNATRRITFASLYLGTGTLEQELVSTLKQRLRQVPSLKVRVLLDYARGTRGKVSSRSMLEPLLEYSSCNVFLYHTPTLRGARKKILPQRWNELVGLQHMKIYIFDNSVVISGANLSNDYFTNRQDRYILIEDCQELADFYEGLITSVSEFSFSLDSKNNIHLHPNWTLDPVTGDSKKFIAAAKHHVMKYYEKCIENNSFCLVSMSGNKSSADTLDTWIFPSIQMGPFGIANDTGATLHLFNHLSSNSRVRLATGYFNLTPNYIEAIISNPAAHFQILMAHPKANGFFGAKFPAGGIPAAYTLLAKRFCREAVAASQEHRIEMKEYFRQGWTFHGKGLWFYPPGEQLPFVTLIGSPNFGYRSVYRDLETQLFIISTNESLRRALEFEQERLYGYSKPFEEAVWMTRDRRVPLWVHLVIRFFKNFF